MDPVVSRWSSVFSFSVVGAHRGFVLTVFYRAQPGTCAYIPYAVHALQVSLIMQPSHGHRRETVHIPGGQSAQSKYLVSVVPDKGSRLSLGILSHWCLMQVSSKAGMCRVSQFCHVLSGKHTQTSFETVNRFLNSSHQHDDITRNQVLVLFLFFEQLKDITASVGLAETVHDGNHHALFFSGQGAKCYLLPSPLPRSPRQWAKTISSPLLKTSSATEGHCKSMSEGVVCKHPWAGSRKS